MFWNNRTRTYTSHSGLALVEICLNRYTDVEKSLKRAIPLRHGISHGDMVKACVGLLGLGKSDFQPKENFRKNRYFRTSLGIEQAPSSARLRQRMNEKASEMLPVVYGNTIEVLAKAEVPVTPLKTGRVALDNDVFPMGNGWRSSRVSTLRAHLVRPRKASRPPPGPCHLRAISQRQSTRSGFGRTLCARRASTREDARQFKTDLDIERLPSGKFDTNDLIMSQAAYACNIVLITLPSKGMALIGLIGQVTPVHHPAKRRPVYGQRTGRRLRAVIQ